MKHAGERETKRRAEDRAFVRAVAGRPTWGKHGAAGDEGMLLDIGFRVRQLSKAVSR